MAATVHRLQTLTLFVIGALAVHELRFLLGYGADHLAQGPGHGYLEFVIPAVIGYFGLLSAYLLRTLIARPEVVPSRRLRLLNTWLLGALLLVAIFVAQELIEQALAGDHAPVSALVPGGGWVVVPLSLAASLVITLLLVGARAVLRAAGTRKRRQDPPRTAPPARLAPSQVMLPRLTVAGTHGALRGPPRPLS